MLEPYLNSAFPVEIYRTENLLVIEDRRPSDALLWSAVFSAGAIVLFALGFRPLFASGLYWLLALLALLAAVFAVKVALLPFREEYVFDKGRGTYTLTRRSLWGRTTTEGDLKQIRAVQMQRQSVDSDGGKDGLLRVTLLLRQTLLMGASDTVILREATPFGSSYLRESRITHAIAGFLKVPVPDTVDV